MTSPTLPFGSQPPQRVDGPIPGPQSRALVDVLAAHECPAVTARRARRAVAIGASDTDPIVWSDARGANVRDVDGNTYVDLTAGFAVALLGHRDPRVVAAITQQADRLLHAMGDAFPDATRVALLARLAALAPVDADGTRLDVAMLGLSGADAVDIAVRTARLATGRPGVIVFDGGYHGLALGVLGLQAYKPSFTDPFRDTTHPFVRTLPWGAPMQTVRDALADGEVGLVLVEPLQGRGGMRVPAPGWLAELAQTTRAHGALVGFDEIQCGLGRTGAWWEGPAQGAAPDLLCTGKALGGGLPLSACLGTRRVMDAWGASQWEAIATQTFLGHPLGCAAGIAALDALVEDDMPTHATQRGARLVQALADVGIATRGRGLMLAAEVGPGAYGVCRRLLDAGWIVLPAGSQDDALALTPPAVLTDAQIEGFARAVQAAIR